MKDGVVDFSSGVHTDLPGDASEQHLEEKEISALCWASSSGSILAVGYIDGDILFWKTSSASTGKGKQAGSCNEVAKLQLSSAERRLPVIVLHWSANSKSHNDCDGQLFIYGGSEIGSEEVITVGQQIDNYWIFFNYIHSFSASSYLLSVELDYDMLAPLYAVVYCKLLIGETWKL